MSTILVPTDFSSNATSALRYAIELSKQMESNLVVFHCSQMSAYALSAATTEEQMTQLLQEDEEHKLEKLQQQVNEAYNSLNIPIPETTRCVVAYNQLVVEQTLEIARANGVNLIVMGTHGASGITKFFFGSNTSVMISKSEIPVLAIPEGEKFTPLTNILFASDLEGFSFELSQLLPFATATKANINVLYLDYHLDPNHNKIETARDIIQKTSYGNIKLHIEPAHLETSLVSQIKKYMAAHRPQCLVMFTRERSLWDRLFMKGSKTEDMSAALNTPLLSYKKG